MSSSTGKFLLRRSVSSATFLRFYEEKNKNEIIRFGLNWMKSTSSGETRGLVRQIDYCILVYRLL